MVKTTSTVCRSAFSMIELIFAIVIIGVAVLSLPMMSQVASKGAENNLAQETIFGASAELNQVMSYYWDERSMEDDPNGLSRVIDSNNDCNDVTKQRIGHVSRRCVNSNSNAAPTIGADAGDLDDIDDVNMAAKLLFTGASSAQAYKQNYTSVVNVSRSSFAAAGINNIKKITVTVYDNDNNTVTALSSYVANIGEVGYHKRTY